MSERKTAEIKFRCTPSFKASVQASAQAADLSMSEYIERACGDFAGKGLPPMIVRQDWNIGDHDALSPDTPGLIEFISTNVTESQPLAPEVLDEALKQGRSEYGSEDAPKLSVAAVMESAGFAPACSCRPWEFCTHKAGA